MQKPTILIADDHTLVVDAFRKLLEPNYEVVGTVGDGLALLDQAPLLRPDVIIIDIGMPLLNGLAAGQRLRRLVPKSKIVYVTMNDDGDLATEALRAGASGYLLKSSAGTELLNALREVLRGATYVTPLIKQAIEEAFVRNPDTSMSAKKLTARQIEVLQLLAEGRGMKEVAEILKLTPRTVAFHKYRMMETLGVHSNAELIRFAVAHHMVNPKSSMTGDTAA